MTPTIPNNAPNTKIEKITTKGCSPNLFPISFGVKRFDSKSCAVKKITAIYIKYEKSTNCK